MIGCKFKDSKKEKFKENLPKNDLIVLEKLGNNFDQLLIKKYDGNIRLFLADVKNERLVFDDNKKGNCDLLKEFEESTLEFKSEILQYDTVYASKSYKLGSEEFYSNQPVIITITQDQDTSWEYVVVYGEETTEKKIEQVKKRGYWNHISESSFVNALIESNLENGDIKEYMEAKKSTGELNPRAMANGILESNIKVDDYFIKYIIVFEIFRKQIRKGYGC